MTTATDETRAAKEWRKHQARQIIASFEALTTSEARKLRDRVATDLTALEGHLSALQSRLDRNAYRDADLTRANHRARLLLLRDKLDAAPAILVGGAR